MEDVSTNRVFPARMFHCFAGPLALAVATLGCTSGGSVAQATGGGVAGTGGGAATDGPNPIGGSGGVTGSGGAAGSGGAMANGGATANGSVTGGGGVAASGGTTANGGAPGSGGTTRAGGATANGGATVSGGTTTSGGTTANGGAPGSGGTTRAGGATANGGATGRGGASGGGTTASGGATGSGGVAVTGGTGGASGGAGATGFALPALPPMPTIPAAKGFGSVALGDPATFAEVKMDFPIETGPFQPTWASLDSNYPTSDPAWLREAKFGIWVHFGPQAAGQSGDWYARKMYIENETWGSPAYDNHIRDFGHPSVAGYKDILQNWNPAALDPAALTKTYHDAGARFLLVQGVHHDEYDNWNSRYQQWNSVHLSPHRDLLAEWQAAVRAQGMRYGVTFHHEYSWWWYQSAFRADVTNNQGKLGVPYDGAQISLASGVGQWWEGLDPRMLYGINLREYIGVYNGIDSMNTTIPQGIFTNHLDYAHWYVTWWALRIMDVIENYDPDFIFTDGDSTQPFSGLKSGSGYKADGIQRVLAHYFNRTLERRASFDTFGIVKFHGPNKGIVTTLENTYPAAVKTDQPWIGEVPVGDWFYDTGFSYDPGMVIRYLLECVSRDGAAAICIALKPDGSLDPGSVTQLQAIGDWMNINSAGIYGSHAWVKYGEGSHTQPTGKLSSTQASATFDTADFRFTVGKDGYLYAYCLKVPAAGAKITITSLGTNQTALSGPIQSVSLLGSTATLVFTQTATGLSITCPASMPFKTAVGFKIEPANLAKPATGS
jgi:alpha-L-fucosidase